MSNRDGFSGGFWLGTLVGGIVGGIVGASIADRRTNRIAAETENGRISGANGERRPFKSSRSRTTLDRMELARQSLDRKINDLNNAIDSVRSSIGNVTEDAIDESVERLDEEIKDRTAPDAHS
jgi:gas vesicle protein